MSEPAAVVVVQARVSSTRLPRKVMMPLAGAATIVRMMERVARVTHAAKYVIATSDDPTDNPLVTIASDHGLPVTRGPLEDVLRRFVLASEGFDVVVRLTADCPLVDPRLVDAHIERFMASKPPVYVSNAVTRTYPDGLDVEVFSRSLLLEADNEASAPFDREHVTPWMQRNAVIDSVTQEVDLSALRWTLDTESDYESLAGIYDALYSTNPAFESRTVYELLLRRPNLIRVEDGSVSLDTVIARIQDHVMRRGSS